MQKYIGKKFLYGTFIFTCKQIVELEDSIHIWVEEEKYTFSYDKVEDVAWIKNLFY